MKRLAGKVEGVTARKVEVMSGGCSGHVSAISIEKSKWSSRDSPAWARKVVTYLAATANHCGPVSAAVLL